MRIRENLGGIIAATVKPLPQSVSIPSQIGKVFGVLLNETTPSKELFDKNGGWSGIGTVFYLDYDQSKNTDNVDLNICKIAKPFHASTQNYPLIGELVQIIDGPSPTSQISTNQTQKYYTGVISVWNNNQQNAPGTGDLGLTFSENGDIRNLLSFEGDRIYQGRKGNGIRFGSTVKLKSNINEWSSVGKDGDPITIMVNGYVTTDVKALTPNIEEVNKEKSSIYMTSTQAIPLIPGASIINPQLNTIKPKDYSDSQLIFNSDRITLNSKKDEVLLFAKTNIELNTDNIINLNAGKVAHINSPYVMLGTQKDGSYPQEPALLGNQVHDFLLQLLDSMSSLAASLTMATVATSEGVIPVTSLTSDAGPQLSADIENLIDKLEKITSDKVFIA
jgi:hypothetical protein